VADFDGRSSFGTWLTRIAINSALMILRKKRGSLEIATDDDDVGADGLRDEIADIGRIRKDIMPRAKKKAC